MNSQSLTKELVLKKITDKCNKNDLTFIGFSNDENEYKNNKTKLILRCNKCGYEWNTTSYDKFVSRSSRCQKCVDKKADLTDEEKIKRILKKCDERNFTFLGFTCNGNLKLKCNKCGAEWNTTTFRNFVRNDRKSHKCGRKNPTSMPKNFKNREVLKKDIVEILENSSLKFVDFVENNYTSLCNLHVILECKICGEKNSYKVDRILSSKVKISCKACQYKNKISNDEVIEIIKEKCKILGYTFLGFNNEKNRYFNKKTKLMLKCNKCGYIWGTTSFDNFKNSVITCRNCTNCWKMEKEVKYFLETEKIEYEEQKRFPWLKNKIAMTLDFYLPKQNIAIECQGKQHFVPIDCYGGEKCFSETNERDKLKLKLCNENGIKILYFNDENDYENFFGNKIIKSIKDLKSIIYG